MVLTQRGQTMFSYFFLMAKTNCFTKMAIAQCPKYATVEERPLRDFKNYYLSVLVHKYFGGSYNFSACLFGKTSVTLWKHLIGERLKFVIPKILGQHCDPGNYKPVRHQLNISNANGETVWENNQRLACQVPGGEVENKLLLIVSMDLKQREHTSRIW